jgi:hypothetical protein
MILLALLQQNDLSSFLKNLKKEDVARMENRKSIGSFYE